MKIINLLWLEYKVLYASCNFYVPYMYR